MKTLAAQEKAELLAVLRSAQRLEHSEIVAVRDYASHILAETRCILDQLLVVPADTPAN
jgi:hypothetical protein